MPGFSMLLSLYRNNRKKNLKKSIRSNWEFRKETGSSGNIFIIRNTENINKVKELYLTFKDRTIIWKIRTDYYSLNKTQFGKK